MPTTRNRTVKPSGGDYSTLSAWEAGEQGDLTSLDEIRQAECFSMTDTSTCFIDGWTTDATRYIRVYATAGAEAKMPYSTSGFKMEPPTSSADAIYWTEDNVRVERIAAKCNVGAGATPWFCVSQQAAGQSRAIGCVAYYVANTATGQAYRHVGTGGTFIFANCVAYTTGSTGAMTVYSMNTDTNAIYAYNCMAYRCTSAFLGNGQIVGIYKNCLYDRADITPGSVFTNVHTDTNYCASTEAGTPGANSRSSQTFTYVNAAGEDFHLASGDAGAKNFGVDLSGDSIFPFSVDIDGVTRPQGASWDIGPTEFASAPAGGEKQKGPPWRSLVLTRKAA